MTVQGVTVQLHVEGQGPALVYFHPGDGLDKSMRLIRDLSWSFRVIAPSPPGFDHSDAAGEMRTVDDLSYFMLDLMDACRVERAVLAGVSFGAWLATEIAVKTQARIGALVLINPVGIKVGGAEDCDIADIFYYSHRDVRSILYADGKADVADYSLLPGDEVSTTVRNREALTWFAWSPLLHNPRLRSRLHRISVPTLVLRATGDRVVSERYARAYCEAISGASFDVVANAGHYVHDEQPLELASRIRAFTDAAMERTAEPST
jgi:pimeloyl-ACP methyl ester carboxylesterase